MLPLHHYPTTLCCTCHLIQFELLNKQQWQEKNPFEQGAEQDKAHVGGGGTLLLMVSVVNDQKGSRMGRR